MATALTLNKRTQIGSSNYASYSQMHLKTYATLTKQENNQSTVKFEVVTWAQYSGYASSGVSFTVDGTTTTKSGTYTWPTSESVVATKTATITHDADGTKTYNGSTSSKTNVLGSASHSWSISLPTTVQAATLLEAPNFTSEDNPTIKYTNPSGTRVTRLRAAITQNVSPYTSLTNGYLDIPKDGTSYTFTFTEAERAKIRDMYPNQTTAAVNFSVHTELPDGTSKFSILERTLTIIPAGKAHINVSGTWKTGTPWVNVSGTWKRAAAVWIKVDGTWKKA